MLKQRVITAVVLAVSLFVGVFALPFWGFAGLVTLVFGVAAWEWSGLAGVESEGGRIGYALLTFVAGLVAAQALGFPDAVSRSAWLTLLLLNTGLWMVIWVAVMTYPSTKHWWERTIVRRALGIWILVVASLSFCYLRLQPAWGLLVFYTAAIVVTADTGAYFAGRRWGRSKLLPRVSPGKTWKGFWGGLVASGVLALSVAQFTGIVSWFELLVITLVAAVASVFGDLFISMLKRYAGVKDSSNLLPGHGGVLDRVDSVLAAAPIIAMGIALAGA